MTDKIEIYNIEGDVLGTYVVDLGGAEGVGDLPEKATTTILSLLKRHGEEAESLSACNWRKKQPDFEKNDMDSSDIKEECTGYILSNFPEAAQRNITMAHVLGQLDAGDQATFAAGLAFVNACRDKCQECINNSEPIYSVEWPQAPADLAGLVANY